MCTIQVEKRVIVKKCFRHIGLWVKKKTLSIVDWQYFCVCRSPPGILRMQLIVFSRLHKKQKERYVEALQLIADLKTYDMAQ